MTTSNTTSNTTLKAGDKVTCRPDGKVRGCRVKEINNNQIKVKWYPGPQMKWMPKDQVVLSENWNNNDQ